jgi:hypothetical protein
MDNSKKSELLKLCHQLDAIKLLLYRLKIYPIDTDQQDFLISELAKILQTK